MRVGTMPRPKKLKALLFDLDGTLVDSDSFHFEAYARTILEHQPSFNNGKAISREFYNENMSGRHNECIVREYWPHLTREEGLALYTAKEKKYGELIADGLSPVPGLIELLDFGDRKGLVRGLVTNAPREMCHATLRSLGIQNRFRHIFLGEECEKPKPDPEVYLQALKALNVDSESAIAFEDSPTGARAAVTAGVMTIGVLTGRSEEELKAVGASLCIPHFAAPQLTQTLSLRIS